MATQKRWRFAPLPPHGVIADYETCGIHPILAQILYQRGFTDPTEAQAFLRGESSLGDPFKLKGMAAAVARIRTAIKRREVIIVYGDFDADGVTSTALLVSVLRALGANVREYIPDRVDEGYGLNDAALIALAKAGAKLVITVDCGIRSLHEVETGIRAGLDMIVTDHHSVGLEIPRATAVINPKQAGCKGEPMLAGVGVTFKLASALIKAAIQQDRWQPTITPDDLLDLVALGTVADLVPLDRPENRALVAGGLARLREAKRPGVRALLDAAGLAPDKVDTTAIGFILAPRINAAGRLRHARLAYELLISDDPLFLSERAKQLSDLNEERQRLTRQMHDFARTHAGLDVLERGTAVPLIFAADADFIQGIVGLVAGRLTEEFYRPSIVVHYDAEKGESHGSCRSIAEFDITAALDQCADLLIRHGGHAQAAGFAIHNDNLPHFREHMMGIAEASLRGLTLQPSLAIDADIPLAAADGALYEALQLLQPCGNSMTVPILSSRRLKVLEARGVGKDNAHLKLSFTDGKLIRHGIAFRMGERAEGLPPLIDLAYELVLNEWNGNQRLEFIIQDIRPSE